MGRKKKINLYEDFIFLFIIIIIIIIIFIFKYFNLAKKKNTVSNSCRQDGDMLNWTKGF